MLTVGHSNRSLEDFVGLLREAGVHRLVDIRSRPASRRHPWFNGEQLAATLAREGMDYQWEGRNLGGLRRSDPRDGERHPGLADTGFQAFARHMEGPAFRTALDRLLSGPKAATALMCAEEDPARCHRSLVADYLELAYAIPVLHIMGPGDIRRHAPHRAARLIGGILRYQDTSGQIRLDL
jgi:uncharacterized protein (DUF488 family)